MKISTLANKTRNNPLIIHINPTGLFSLNGNNYEEKFIHFHNILNAIQDAGGNIAIPAFSYSYTQNETYDMRNTPSKLDFLSEFLREKNASKRTIDPNFSYLLFGNNFSTRHYRVSDTDSFGTGSLIDDIYHKDGYLGAIGGALEYLTEVHFIEKKLGVDYRFDKKFKGVTISNSGKKKHTSTTYFCKDLDLNYRGSLSQLKNDLISEKLLEEWTIDSNNLKIQVIRFRDIYDFIKDKIKSNPKYFW